MCKICKNLYFLDNYEGLIPYLKELERNLLLDIFYGIFKNSKKKIKSLPDEGIEPGRPNGTQRET